MAKTSAWVLIAVVLVWWRSEATALTWLPSVFITAYIWIGLLVVIAWYERLKNGN